MDLGNIGKPVSEGDNRKLLEMVNTLLNNPDRIKFPGFHPVTLMNKHMKFLLENDYLVCEKTDGVRAFLYIMTTKSGTPCSLLLDRKNAFYLLPVSTPRVRDTLLDGEVVAENESGEEFVHFIAHDMLVYEGENVTRFGLLKRLGCAMKFLRSHKETLCRKGGLKISIKQMTKSYGIREVYEGSSRVLHKVDGLIFTPVNEPYRPGTEPKLFKWKPEELNTADFLMEKMDGYSGLVYKLYCIGERNEMVLFDYYFDYDNRTGLDGALGELWYNKKKEVVDIADFSICYGGWDLLKIRTDKKSPNSISTVISIMNSIQENVGIDALINIAPEIRRNWKARSSARRAVS